jgi:hypothetical protein
MTEISGRTFALALVLLASSPLFAGGSPPSPPPTANFYLNSPGSGLNYAGVYTSPYTGQINPGSTTIGGATVNVICDDFASNSFVDEDWTAYVTTLSSLAAGTYGTPDEYLNWNGASSDGLNQLQAYQAAAILAIEIDNTDPLGTGLPSLQTEQEELSYALWALFDPTQAAGTANQTTSNLANSPHGPADWVEGSGGWLAAGSFLTAVNTYLSTAVNQVATNSINGGTVNNYLSGYNVTIYSYDTGAVCYPGPVPCQSIPPQEFITVTPVPGGSQIPSVPEASSLAQLAAYILLGGAGWLFWGRRRIFRTGN